LHGFAVKPFQLPGFADAGVRFPPPAPSHFISSVNVRELNSTLTQLSDDGVSGSMFWALFE
jgi:hypothetical protein